MPKTNIKVVILYQATEVQVPEATDRLRAEVQNRGSPAKVICL